MVNQKRIIGILGGMGPEATVDLYSKIIKVTPAKKDQDHLRIIIVNDPQVPDRTKAILHGGPDPLPKLLEDLQILKNAGADFAIMPCNTAHYYIKELRAANLIPIIDMIEETINYIVENHPSANCVGLLATDGTVQSQIYHKWAERQNLHLITPIPEDQKKVMSAIYDFVKKGDISPACPLLSNSASNLIDAGAEVLIAGCTEIPLALTENDVKVSLIDPTNVLALKAFNYAIED